MPDRSGVKTKTIRDILALQVGHEANNPVTKPQEEAKAHLNCIADYDEL
jgi:hypothetical protein